MQPSRALLLLNGAEMKSVIPSNFPSETCNNPGPQPLNCRTLIRNRT